MGMAYLWGMVGSGIIIRRGGLQDMEGVHRLVRVLAEYERAPEAVLTRPSTFADDYEEGWFDLLVAEADGMIIGIALGHRAYSTWKGRMCYLDDLVVDAAWRSQGVGTMLFDAFINMAKEAGAKVLKWQVLDWNQPAIDFYIRHEAELESGWLNVRKYIAE